MIKIKLNKYNTLNSNGQKML